jgi:GNAT superfamily N-acetyltransferase
VTTLPPTLREAALFPELDLPDPPEGHPFQVRKGDGYQLGFTKGNTFAMVFVRRLPGETLAACVSEVRTQLSAEGFERAAWIVSEAAEPAGVAADLEALGLVPWERDAEGFERRFASMALATEPAPPPDGVVARRVETFEEFVAAARVAQDAFDTAEADRKQFEDRQSEYWKWQQRYADFATFAAFVDGEIVGNASMIFGATAGFMIGGSVREDRRGRGAYRALVRARWDAAVERGTPALTVGAGAMSGPVLERLGFVTVGHGDVLSDRF